MANRRCSKYYNDTTNKEGLSWADQDKRRQCENWNQYAQKGYLYHLAWIIKELWSRQRISHSGLQGEGWHPSDNFKNWLKRGELCPCLLCLLWKHDHLESLARYSHFLDLCPPGSEDCFGLGNQASFWAENPSHSLSSSRNESYMVFHHLLYPEMSPMLTHDEEGRNLQFENASLHDVK